MIADAGGRAVAFAPAPGRAHEPPLALALLGRPPRRASWVAAGRGYAAHAFRERVREPGSRPAIPPERDEAAVACRPWIHHDRNRVERLWGRPKEWRVVAARHEKTAASLMGVLCIAAGLDRLRR